MRYVNQVLRRRHRIVVQRIEPQAAQFLTVLRIRKHSTVGGMLSNPEDREELSSLRLDALYDYAMPASQYLIDVPHLTHREKLTLDSLLPATGDLEVDDLPFEIRDSELAAYVKFYLYYPVFGEY